MTLIFDPMTLKTYSVHVPSMVITHVKFGENPSTHFRDIKRAYKVTETHARTDAHTDGQTDQKHNASGHHLRLGEA